MPKLIIKFGRHIPQAGFYITALLSIIIGSEVDHPDRETRDNGSGIFEITDTKEHLELTKKVLEKRSWQDSKEESFQINRKEGYLQMAIGDMGENFDRWANQLLDDIKTIEIVG